jgi:SAM-dependent methyltransferase
MQSLPLQYEPEKHSERQLSTFAVLEEFPGWERVGGFIKSIILRNNAKMVADIGGGRLPRIDLDFVRKNSIEYHLFDISEKELAMADAGYRKVVMDVGASDADFAKANAPTGFDLVFSHMLLEHLQDPLQAHRNFHKMLRPGGLSVHLFPSRNNLPLAINSVIPEKLSYRILKLVQPHRDTVGDEGKFEAYYRMCGAPSDNLRRAYESIGFEVVRHTGYVGHEYYKRIKPLAALENLARAKIARIGLPLISANLLILRKPL